MIQREFLQDADKLLKIICEKGFQKSTEKTELEEAHQGSNHNLTELLLHMAKKGRGHINYYGHVISPTKSGLEFFRSTSYVQEFDNSYRDSERQWYESENAKKQFEDFPKVKKQALAAIIISALLLILEVIKLIVSH